MSTTDSNEEASRTLADIERSIDERFAVDYDRPLLSGSRSNRLFEAFLYLFGFVFAAYHMYYGYSGVLSRSEHGILHLALVLFLWGALKAADVDRSDGRGKALSAGYLLYAAVSVVPLAYIFDSYQSLINRAGLYYELDIYMGILLIVLLLVALLSVSRLIALIVTLGLVYSYYGPLMPGIFRHRGLSPNRIITMNTVEFQGVLGNLLQISATWVVIFLILAGLMEKYGGMAAFIKGVTRIAVSSRRIEIGQVAVAASAFMGSINGSTAANTATTGAFTIPLMKENGYSAKLAGAIEAVASCGGQILPPIMGAGAFLMAELIEPTYSEIIIAAALPAVLFFLTVGVSISFNSRRTVAAQRVDTSGEDGSLSGRLVGAVGHYEYIAMFAVLLYWLVYVQADPMLAGFYSILALIALRLVRRATEAVRDGVGPGRSLLRFSRETFEGFRRGAEATVNITILLASLGIVIRALIVTGFAQQLSTRIVMIAGSSLLLLLVLSMCASIAFGMGMSTTAAYMLVAILVAPALTQVGLDPLTAHFFVFYFAIVSNITPPIALSVVIAQGIADAGYLETSLESLKLGFPMFLLPFTFVYNPELLYFEAMTLPVFALVLLGYVAISAGVAGRVTRSIALPFRVGLTAVGVALLFAPSVAAQAILAVVAFGTLFYVSRGTIRPRPSVE